MNFFVTACIFAATIFSRPMILGYSLGPISLVFSILAAVSAIFLARKRKIRQSDAMGLAVLFVTGFAYSSVLVDSSLEQALANFIIVTSFGLATFLSVSLHGERFFRGLKIIFRLVVLSGLTTGIYFYIFGHSGFSTTWVVLSIATDRSDIPVAHIRFPFSTIFSDLTSDLFVGARSSFLAIEPGVSPAVLVLQRCLEEDSGRRRIVKDIAFILAMAMSLSTTAPLSAGLYFFGRYIFFSSEKPLYFRLLLATAVAIGFSFVFLYAPYFGYYAKSETHFASFDTRLSWFTDESSSFIQISSLILCCSVFVFLNPWLSRDAALIAPTFLLVSALNVLEFSPLFILGVFVSIRRPSVQRVQSKLLQPHLNFTPREQETPL